MNKFPLGLLCLVGLVVLSGCLSGVVGGEFETGEWEEEMGDGVVRLDVGLLQQNLNETVNETDSFTRTISLRAWNDSELVMTINSTTQVKEGGDTAMENMSMVVYSEDPYQLDNGSVNLSGSRYDTGEKVYLKTVSRSLPTYSVYAEGDFLFNLSRVERGALVFPDSFQEINFSRLGYDEFEGERVVKYRADLENEVIPTISQGGSETSSEVVEEVQSLVGDGEVESAWVTLWVNRNGLTVKRNYSIRASGDGLGRYNITSVGISSTLTSLGETEFDEPEWLSRAESSGF